jgi:molybdopterin-guanine dinucleotide biosynthesis protein A
MKNMLINCTGVILAGGENRRMPIPKAFIKIRGIKIIERSLSIMKSLFREVFIVTDRPADYVHLGVPMLGDAYDIRGPMTGILTSLICSSNSWIFATACDMPFINEELIRYGASQREGYEAVTPLLDGLTEPLFSFYSRRLIPGMEKTLLSGDTGLKDFLNTKRVKYLREKEIRKIDPGISSFVNFNTPEDLEIYKRKNPAKIRAHARFTKALKH